MTLDGTAQRRLEVLDYLRAGVVTLEQAALLLERSPRHVQRLAAAYRARGPAALIHGNRGRPPANRMPDATRARLAELASTTYAGFNRTHLAEHLAETEALVVPDRTLRRILTEQGLPPTRTRRYRRDHRRRERRPRAGELLQVDGSRHDWLEGRGPWLTLVGGIDDATGVVPGARFRDQEDAAGYFDVFLQTVHGPGRPLWAYSDRHGIFWRDRARPPTLAEQLTGQRSLTQVGRALDDAGIGWIAAHSPQAKGRIERAWGTFQDRLVSELRLAGADTLAGANVVLARYLARHNRRFGVPPADPEPAWRPWTAARPAEAVFCFRYERRVARDATISWGRERLALLPRRDGGVWAGVAVVVQERIDGSLWVEHAGHQYRLAVAPADPAVLRARGSHPLSTLAVLPVGLLVAEQAGPPAPSAGSTRGASKPAPGHPWRKSFKRPT